MPKPIQDVGLPSVDGLAELALPKLQDYVDGVSAYVRQHGSLSDGQKKAAQIRLSTALARVLPVRLPQILAWSALNRARAGATL